MKALIKSEEAQAGVGTLIIFIAMVLVAAVAAAVLLQTQGAMNTKSTQTTSQSAAAISENLFIEAIDGNTTSAGTLQTLNITVRVAAGGSDVDLSKVLVKVNALPYNYSTGTGYLPGSNFLVYTLRDPNNGTGTSTTINYSTIAAPMLKSGALVRIDVTGLGFLSKTTVPITLTPEKGTSVITSITLPAIVQGNNAIYP